MSEFEVQKKEEIREPGRTLDISSGYAAYHSMGEAAFQVYVNGFYGMAIQIPGLSNVLGSDLGTDLLVVIPSAAIEDFATKEKDDDAEI